MIIFTNISLFVVFGFNTALLLLSKTFQEKVVCNRCLHSCTGSIKFNKIPCFAQVELTQTMNCTNVLVKNRRGVEGLLQVHSKKNVRCQFWISTYKIPRPWSYCPKIGKMPNLIDAAPY